MSSSELAAPTAAWLPAPRPADDLRRVERLRALAVLDTPAEAFSNAVATAAAAIANVPISALSLIDVDRQWVKASCGIDMSEVPRDITLCAYTVLDLRPLIVPDTWLDARFASNPFVVSAPYIRFYAGFPVTVQEQPVGSLCVIDDRPRTLSPAQTTQLLDLARGVAAWMLLNVGRRPA